MRLILSDGQGRVELPLGILIVLVVGHGQTFDVPSQNFATLARIVRRVMPYDSAFAPRGHVNFEILNIIIHLQTVSYAPTSLEHPTRHRILIEPHLLLRFHGDLSPRKLNFAAAPLHPLSNFKMLIAPHEHPLLTPLHGKCSCSGFSAGVFWWVCN
jgi:hypothetical protein